MTDITKFESKINDHLNDIQNEIENISKKKELAQKKLLIKKLQLKLKTTKGVIEAYELEIEAVEADKAAAYKMSLTKCRQRFEKVKTDFEFKKNEGEQNELFNNNNISDNQNPTDPSQMNQQQLINYADNLQDEGIRDLEQIEAKIEDGNQVADNILLEMDKQIEQLNRIQQNVYDTKSILSRTNKLLRYFGRVMHTDKIIMGLMGCVCVAILVLIIMSASGLDNGELNVPDKLPGDKE